MYHVAGVYFISVEEHVIYCEGHFHSSSQMFMILKRQMHEHYYKYMVMSYAFTNTNEEGLITAGHFFLLYSMIL